MVLPEGKAGLLRKIVSSAFRPLLFALASNLLHGLQSFERDNCAFKRTRVRQHLWSRSAKPSAAGGSLSSASRYIDARIGGRRLSSSVSHFQRLFQGF